MQSQHIPHKNLSLYTESFGNPDDAACLLISGAGAPARFWTDRFCHSLALNGYFVIRYDNRDTGLSTAVDYDLNPYSVFDLADDAVAILDAHDIEKAHVVGHSMGGLIAQILAVEYPGRVLSFTSLSVGVTKTAHPPAEIMEVLMQNNPQGNFEEDLPAFMRSWAIINGTVPLDETLAQAYTQDLYDRSIHKVGVAWNHIKCEQDLRDLPEKLKLNSLPGLFLHGEKDPLIPPQAGRENAALTPHSKFMIIPGMGHMIFNQAIEDQILRHLLNHLHS